MLKTREELKVSENVVYAKNILKKKTCEFYIFFCGKTRLPEAKLEEVQL